MKRVIACPDERYPVYELVDAKKDGPDVIVVSERFLQGYLRFMAEFEEWQDTIETLRRMKTEAWRAREGEEE